MARKNLDTWATATPTGQRFLVNYVFKLSPQAEKVYEEPIGDAFDRFFLRLLRRRTTRTIHECIPDETQQRYVSTLPDETIEITIVAGQPCLQTQDAAVDKA